MRLEHLCDMELTYRLESFGRFLLIQPYGGGEGAGYGEGEGAVTGERLHGTIRWVNHPRRRSDGTMLPNVHGVIQAEGGAQILFSLQGRTVWVGSGGDRRGRQNLMVMFEAEDERHRWLNDTVCVLEGAIDPRTMSMRSHIYVCINELV